MMIFPYLRAQLVNLIESQQSVMANPLTHDNGKDVPGASKNTEGSDAL